MRLNNRWFQLGASLVAMIMIANLQYSWTLFVNPLQKATGWKLSDIQFAFTLFILCQTWVQPLDGWLIDRLGPRGFITAAGVLGGLGWGGGTRHRCRCSTSFIVWLEWEPPSFIAHRLDRLRSGSRTAVVWHPASSLQDSVAGLLCSFPSSRQRLSRRDIRPHSSRPGSFRAL